MGTRQTERLEQIECAACGTPVPYAGTGRPPRYCGASCRRTGWALQQAQQRLDRDDDPRPEVVHETVTQERVRTVNRPELPPSTLDGWRHLLPNLTHQLRATPQTNSSADYRHRKRLATDLMAALAALHDTTPGGLDWHQLARTNPAITRALTDTTTTPTRPATTPPPAPSERTTPPPPTADTPADATAGLSRQQRRAAERQRRKHRH